jgi:hypothetical protein
MVLLEGLFLSKAKNNLLNVPIETTSKVIHAGGKAGSLYF